jgi:hypothetical protein
MIAATTATLAQPDAAASAEIFDRMAEQARQQVQGHSIEQVGAAMLDKLDGFVERTRRSEERVQTKAADMANPSRESPPSTGSQPADGDDRVNRALDSMRQMFDRSIETQLVVRAATQLSGAANTLVRGQ